MAKVLENVNTTSAISFFKELTLIWRNEHAYFRGDGVYNVDDVILLLKTHMPDAAKAFSNEISLMTDEKLSELLPDTHPLRLRARAKRMLDCL